MARKPDVPKTLDVLEAFKVNEERDRRRTRAFGRDSGLIALAILGAVLFCTWSWVDPGEYYELGRWGFALVAGLVAAFVAFLGVNVAFRDWRPVETTAVAAGEVERFEHDGCHGARVGSIELSAPDVWTDFCTRYSPCVTMKIGVSASVGEYEVLLSPVAAKALAGELARLADTYAQRMRVGTVPMQETREVP
jgi:hypothetical protein